MSATVRIEVAAGQAKVPGAWTWTKRWVINSPTPALVRTATVAAAATLAKMEKVEETRMSGKREKQKYQRPKEEVIVQRVVDNWYNNPSRWA
jgi:hypothetical protein